MKIIKITKIQQNQSEEPISITGTFNTETIAPLEIINPQQNESQILSPSSDYQQPVFQNQSELEDENEKEK